MKHLKKFIVLFLQIFSMLAPVYSAGSIEEFLKELPLENIRVLEREAFYSKIYEVSFQQPIDHHHPELGSFGQKLYISHVSESLPVVLVTEGYSADYYYTSEPASLLKCNQIICEHRYFGESKPDSLIWEYLTTWQSASDHHRIIQKFKTFYKSDWISTGISKGGQSVMYHSFYYPEDIQVRIPYVAPLNISIEDPRIYDFLDKVGSGNCRRKIHRFQIRALKNEEELIPAFKAFSDKKGYTYELAGGIEKAFEYCVLEYSFAFWQWQYVRCQDIPGRFTEPERIISHMNMVGGFDYFSDQFIDNHRPFFYQAYTEMGYYGYKLKDFRTHLNYVTQPGFEFTLPKNIDIHFNSALSEDLKKYLQTDAERFIFIYGEYDTWSATAVDLAGNENSTIIYKEKGSHRTRVRNLPESKQEEFINEVKKYLNLSL